jgi:hypothetical protein
LALRRPIDPALELIDGVFVALDFLPVEVGVAGVEVEAVFAGDERERLVEVGSELGQVAGLAGVVAGGLMPPDSSPSGDSVPATSSPCQQWREIGMAARRLRTASVSTPDSA